jgi:hypothetical protein
MNTYKPTRLYVKKHTVTGLRYFGKSVVKDITKYDGSGTRWNNHLKKHNKKHVITEWVSGWFDNKEDLISFATAFSQIFDIVNSSDWANLTEETGISGGSYGVQGSIKRSQTISSSEWKSTKGLSRSKKLSDTRNDPEWQETTGKESRKRQGESLSKTMNNPEWKSTTGASVAAANIARWQDEKWLSTKGKEGNEKSKATRSDPAWQSTIGKERNEKIRQAKLGVPRPQSVKDKLSKALSGPNNPNYGKPKNFKKLECPHCHKLIGVNNINRHLNKCNLTLTSAPATVDDID